MHWDYVLSIEDDLLRLSRFVDFSGNDATYSIEIARILMAASAEADVVLKALSHSIDPDCKPRRIDEYFPIVTGEYPNLVDIEVQFARYSLTLEPWTDWTHSNPPQWWTANNKVKHERATRFASANLKNCLNAVAGLFASVLYLYRERARAGELVPVPALLRVPGTVSNAMNAHPVRFFYRLP